MIKTFRGQIPGDDAGNVTRIALHTNDGKTGYTIKKFQTMQKSPGSQNCEGLVIIWKTKPTTAEIAQTTFDLSDQRILGVSFYSASTTSNIYPEDMTIIIDQVVFNQDIFITYFDVSTVNDPMNYYLELEQAGLDLNESTVATLQSIRNA